MTGGEIVAAGKAVEAAGRAGKAALTEEEAVKAKLLELAENSPALQDAADAYARRIHIKQGVITKLYEPLAKLLGIQKDYFDSKFADELATRAAHIPDEAIKSPLPSVALPAMQGLGWSLEEPDLKEMYLNLLVTATDGRHPERAHPSFADIIKQLSATEAQSLLLALGVPKATFAIAQLRASMQDAPGAFGVIVDNLFEPFDGVLRDRFEDESEGVWIANWERLGLLTTSYSQRIAAAEAYDWVARRPEFLRVKGLFEAERLEIEADTAEHAGDEGFVQTRVARGVSFDPGMARVTDFGKRFLSAVGPATDVTIVPTEPVGDQSTQHATPAGA